MRVLRERLSISCLCPSPFGVEGENLDLIVLIPIHFLSVYFLLFPDGIFIPLVLSVEL